MQPPPFVLNRFPMILTTGPNLLATELKRFLISRSDRFVFFQSEVDNPRSFCASKELRRIERGPQDVTIGPSARVGIMEHFDRKLFGDIESRLLLASISPKSISPRQAFGFCRVRC